MTRVLGRLRALVLGVLGVVLVAALWDLYKAFGLGSLPPVHSAVIDKSRKRRRQ